MIYKYLVVAGILIAQSASAQLSLQTGQKREGLLALNASAAGQPGDYLTTYPTSSAAGRGGDYSSGNGVTSVCFYTGLDLGGVVSSGKVAGQSLSGGGLMYQLEMGAKIPLHLKIGYKQYILSAALGYWQFSSKIKFKDGTGASQKGNYQFTVIGLPVSYSVSALNKRGGPLGYYWQAGANIGMINKVTEGGKDVSKSFNNLLIAPSVSAGLSFTFDGAEGRIQSGTFMAGIYVSDAVMNLAKDNGVTMHALFYGLRLAFIRS